MKIQNKGAVLVQIAPLFISQPRNQNQSITTIGKLNDNDSYDQQMTRNRMHTKPVEFPAFSARWRAQNTKMPTRACPWGLVVAM